MPFYSFSDLYNTTSPSSHRLTEHQTENISSSPLSNSVIHNNNNNSSLNANNINTSSPQLTTQTNHTHSQSNGLTGQRQLGSTTSHVGAQSMNGDTENLVVSLGSAKNRNQSECPQIVHEMFKSSHKKC